VRNITLAVDDDIYAKARRKAALENTSISRIVAEYLRQWISETDLSVKRKQRLKRLFRQVDNRKQVDPAVPLTREEIYAGRIR
jgi:hypothetical protein